MKKLLLTIAFAITLMLPSVAQTYYIPTKDVEVIYTTAANLADAAWAVDINGEKNYGTRTGKEATINPETDEVYTKTTKFEGIYLKQINDNAARSIIFYITGITEFKAYACDGSASTEGSERYVQVVYEAKGEASNPELTGTNTDCSSVLAISNLDPAKEYRFHVNANNKDMCLYAIKLTKGATEDMPPYITTVTPEEDAEDVALDAAITFAYSKAVTESPTVIVNGNAATLTTEDNINYTVSGVTLEYATTYEVAVSATDDGDVEAKSWSFTTMNNPAYAYIEPVPADGATEVALDATVQLNPSETLVNPVITVLEDGVAIESTYDAENDVVEFEKGYLKVYTITVTAGNLDGATEWSFTTEEEVVCPVQLTTESKNWTVEKPKTNKTPTAGVAYVVDNTFYIYTTRDQDSDNKGVKFDKIANGNYMMFALPANVKGVLSFTAQASSSKDVYYELKDTWEVAPTNEKNATAQLGTVADATNLSVEITTTAVTYVYLYNTGGNAYYNNITWTVVYDENIVTETSYFLNVNKQWEEPEGCWYAAKFVNKNTDAYAWVKGEKFESGDKSIILYYLSQYNVPSTRSGEVVYTDVEFIQLPATVSSDADLYSLDLTGVEYKTTGEVFYESGVQPYYTLSSAEAGEWETSVPTAIENIEVADGIRYACGVVEAEGAIEVYSVNGAVVARGNDIVDLRGLAAGVYVVRCGDQVRKVVR